MKAMKKTGWILSITLALILLVCGCQSTQTEEPEQTTESEMNESAGESTGEASGETSGETTGETSGETGGETNIETTHVHTPVTDIRVEPTCGATGLTEGSHCSACGEVLTVQEIIPATRNHGYGENDLCVGCGRPRPTEALQYGLNEDEQSYSVVGIDWVSVTDIVIADVYQGLPVTGIQAYAFAYSERFTSMNIPDTVTSIGSRAFDGCTNLIQTEGGVQYVDKWAIGFDESADESITEITLRADTKGIGDDAFYGCDSLTSITIPTGVTSIGKSAFEDCSSITSIIIPDSVTNIGLGAFSGCESLTVAEGNSVYHAAGNCLIETDSGILIQGFNNSVIPTDGSVTSIGDYAFYGCSSLTSITIPNSVTSIGEDAFSGCSSLTSITIPDSVTNIGAWAFSRCWRLTSITIPDSVTSIGEYAFYNCDSLTSITIPAGVVSIGDGAFYSCGNIKSITVAEGNSAYHAAGNCLIETESRTLIAGCNNSVIPTDESVTSIGDSAFSGHYLTSITIPENVTSIGYGAFSACYNLTDITISNGVQSIASYAFEGCSSLESITIPDSVMSIGEGAFSSCGSLASITVSEGNSVYHATGNCLIETESRTLLAGCNNSVIPTDGSVTSIAQRAFYDRDGLTSITIPAGVTSIGWYAFCYCESLTDITFQGTTAEWEAISKDWYWDDGTGDYTVTCTDGTVAKDGTVTPLA